MKNAKLKLKIQNFKRELSAGGVVFKRSKAFLGSKPKALFLLGKHSGYHKWVLPKGLIEEGESPWTTAIRETEEEMGVKCRLIGKEPVYVERYVYWADLKKLKIQNEKCKIEIKNSKLDRKTRRVEKYQESFDSAQDKQGKGETKVFKTVTFYLLEYVSGDPKEHGWEMEKAGWFDYDEALTIMSFKGEKEALKKALAILQNSSKQPFLF